ncbi:cupin domain-containing protein [Mesorhizobium sp. IMUNJ 23232]|uniref:cupin domain-containing protein n=1 Tax=Mesorhizobium TaxID=68287 RepID=UPI0037B0F765
MENNPMKSCKFIRGGKQFRGRQGLDYFAGISAETVGSEGICMHLLTMPPGATAKAHYHQAHETAIYMLEGVIEVAHGPNLERVDRGQAGDFVYIPAGVPHQPRNPTGQVAKALIARTDPKEQESVVLLTEEEATMRPHMREDRHDLD